MNHPTHLLLRGWGGRNTVTDGNPLPNSLEWMSAPYSTVTSSSMLFTFRQNSFFPFCGYHLRNRVADDCSSSHPGPTDPGVSYRPSGAMTLALTLPQPSITYVYWHVEVIGFKGVAILKLCRVYSRVACSKPKASGALALKPKRRTVTRQRQRGGESPAELEYGVEIGKRVALRVLYWRPLRQVSHHSSIFLLALQCSWSLPFLTCTSTMLSSSLPSGLDYLNHGLWFNMLRHALPSYLSFKTKCELMQDA